MNSKKGVSPLIATVLLVAFSVALGAVVMNFQDSTTHEFTDQADLAIDREITCSLDLSLSVLEVQDIDFACYNHSGSNNFEVIVENHGSKDIEGMQIVLLDKNNEIYRFQEFNELDSHGVTKYNVSLGPDFVFPPDLVILSAIIDSKGSKVVCKDNRIELESICECDREDCVYAEEEQ